MIMGGGKGRRLPAGPAADDLYRQEFANLAS
jgi:hypothetical protein